MNVDGAIAPAADGGVTLHVEVVPGAKESVFPVGYNAWRKRVEARVRAPPEKGEANAELSRLVADFFNLAPARVAVSAGATTRRKTLHLSGISLGEARARLEAWSG